jgi:hypothetical protein
MYTITNLTQATSGLSLEDQQKLFQLITDNAELFNKVMPDMPLIRHILNNTDSDHPLVQLYVQWKNSVG